MLYNFKENKTPNSKNFNSLSKPHIENSSSKKSFSSKNENSYDFKNTKKSRKNKILENNNKQTKNVFEELIDYIPEYQYDIIPKKNKGARNKNQKGNIDIVPFDRLESNNSRFYNCNEAFLYIGKHCKKYHGKYTRDYCKRYLKECFIIDFIHDEFVPITKNLSQKQFNKYFYYSQRELKYL